MNTKLRQKTKSNFEKDLFKLMNNAVFGKTMEDVRKDRNIKLVATERSRNYLVSEPNYHTLILDLSKAVMCEFWYDYVKPKYGENEKNCYMDTESFIVHIKADDTYKDIAKDVKTRFDTSNFQLNIPLPKGKNKKVIGLMKN